MPALSPPAAAGSPEAGLGNHVLLCPASPGDARLSTWVVESSPGHACFCHQAESTRGFRQRWRAAGQSAEAPAGQWETQQTGVEKGRGEDCPARQRPGAGAGWRVRLGGGGESGCWLCKGSRHIYWVLVHTPRGVSE